MALGVVAGLALAGAKPVTYSSATTLLVNQIPGNPYTPDSNSSDTLAMLQTEAVAVTSQDVLQKVEANVGSAVTAVGLRQNTSVAVPPNTQALQISYTSKNSQLSTQVVNSIATAYLAARQAQATAIISSQVANLTTQLTSARTALKRANVTHDPNASSIRASIIDLQSRIATARAQPTNPGQVLTPGSVPSGSPTSHLVIFAIAGLILGTLVGLAAAAWRERRKDLVRSIDDLDEYPLGAPVTAVNGKELDNRSLRQLRMRLSPQTDSQVVALVGTLPGESLRFGVLLGSSFVGGDTAVALIDGTGTDPGHHDPLGFDDKPGLAESLIADTPPTCYTVEKNFDYLPAGQDPDSASEYLVDPYARAILKGVADDHDLTMIACMPLETIEGEALARSAGGVVLLVQLNKTTHHAFSLTLRTLKSQGFALLGVFVLPIKL